MQNWSTDTQKLKNFSSKYKLWKTEQMLNFGMAENDKLDKKYVKNNLNKLSIDPDMKSYLQFVFANESK